MKNKAIKFLAAVFFVVLAFAPSWAQTNATIGTGKISVPTNAAVQNHHNNSEDWGNVTINPLGIPLAGMVMVVIVVFITFHARNHREKMLHETVRAMIEKGMPVSSELIAQLGRHSHGPRQASRPRHLLPGLILMGVGFALLLNTRWGSSGGLIIEFVGLAFVIVWLVERKQNQNDERNVNATKEGVPLTERKQDNDQQPPTI